MKISSIGIIGNGAFGSFVVEQAEQAVPFIRRVVFDPKHASTTTIYDAAECDVVVVATPVSGYPSVLKNVIPLMREGSLLVGACTVQMPSLKLMRRLHTGRVLFLNAHALFGRQSWLDNKKSLKDLEVAITGHTLPESVFSLACQFLRDLGLKVVFMDAEEHDRDVVAREQWLTQYGGQLVIEAGFGLNQNGIHTRSAKLFFAAMQIVGGDTNLFWEAYDANPYCGEVAERFEQAVLAMRRRRLARDRKNRSAAKS